MMKKLSLIGAAVAVVMAAAPAMALPVVGAGAVVDSTPGAVRLIISGSSAFQLAFETELNSASSSICQSGTYNKYTGAVTTAPQPNQLAAYSCTSQPALFGGTAKPTIIYYRSEGGSAYGLAPVVRTAAKVYRLVLTAACDGGSCPVGSNYVAATDTIVNPTAQVVDSNSDLGLADEEASMFVGSNYPTAPKVLPALTGAEIATLNANSSPLVLQSFGVYVNAGANSLAGLTSLSKEVIADVFRGKWSDWNQVPKNDGSNTTVTAASLPIKVCRREQGSGTQVAAAVFFHNTNCGGADEFVQDVAGFSGNLDPLTQVLPQTSTGNMRTCLNTNAGAIGFISAEADAAGQRKLIRIDGQGPSPGALNNNLGISTASGDYGFAFELIAVKRPGLSGDPLTLANKLISISQDQATGPTTGNVTFLPTGNNAGNAVFPLATPTGKQPVSCFSRSGNSCSTLADAC